MLSATPGVAAWGLVTGVAMGKAGLPLLPMLLMSVLVYAGSAQLAVLPVLAAGAPLWVVWATAACVNLRFVVFSLAWRPYLMHLPLGQRLLRTYLAGDLNFFMFTRRFPQPQPQPEQTPYFWGLVAANWPAWQVSSLVGLLAADAVPVQWGLGFAGTLALVGIAASLLDRPSAFVTGGVAAAAAVAAFALPLRLNTVVAIAAAVAAGLWMDQAERSRRRQSVP